MTTTDPSTDQTIGTCNALLRAELAAVETYTLAIDAFTRSVWSPALERICSNHRSNVEVLSMLVRAKGATPSTGFRVWGNVVQSLEGASTIQGESAALQGFQEGEAHVISACQEALANPDVSKKARNLIQQEVLPPLSSHLVMLQARLDHSV